MTQVLRLYCFAEEPEHGPFDVSIPETVDEGIQQNNVISVPVSFI